ncbi:MAG: hypothetical protein J6K21_00885 [Bacilli bacterium]|nr:hypothetical protein [Bacilli bacterium]
MKNIDYSRYILKKENVSSYEIKRAIKNIENLDDYSSSIILSKLYIKNNEYLKSLNILNNLKENGKNNLSLYYNLFITNVYLEKYKEAMENLNICNLKKEVNNTVLYYLITVLNNTSKNKIIRNEKIRNINIYDKKLMNLYNMFIDFLEQEEYKKALNLLIECKNISNINFDIEINLLNKIIEKKELEKDNLISNTLTKKNIFLKNNDINNYINSIYILLNNNYGSYDYYLNEVNFLINYDLKTSNELLEKINSKYHLENNYKVKYLENKIKEKNYIYNEIEEYFLEKANKAYKMKDYEYALVIYYIALEVTNNNIFNYYIGKIEFKLKNYKASKYYLNEYMLNGASKYSKSLLYLYHIAYIEKKKNNEFKDKIIKINNYENSDFEFYTEEFGYSKKLDKSRKIIDSIKMTEEEFRR